MKKRRVVGIRELKSGLSEYLKKVRDGQSIVVTDRGQPIAEISPIKADTEMEARLLKLAAEGRVTLPTRSALQPFKPIKLRGGKLLSTVVIEDREDRF